MKEFKYVIKDEQGIHARPAGLFVKEAAAFPCKVTIEKDGKEADAKRIFAVMGLAVKCGQEITLKTCLLYTSPSPRDGLLSRMPSSA